MVLAGIAGYLFLIHLIRFFVLLFDNFKGWTKFYETKLCGLANDYNYICTLSFPGLHEVSVAFEVMTFLACLVLAPVLLMFLFFLNSKAGAIVATSVCATLICAIVIIEFLKIVKFVELELYFQKEDQSIFDGKLGKEEEETADEVNALLKVQFAFLIIWLLFDCATICCLVIIPIWL